MKNLFIIKRIIEDKSISDKAFAVWCALRNIMQKDKREYFISFNMIAWSLFNRPPSRREAKAIKDGYDELNKLRYIKDITEYSQTEYTVDLSELYYETKKEYFSDLREEEMHKIMNMDSWNNKYKMLRYFACMVGTFNRSKTLEKEDIGKFGGMGLDAISELVGISKNTAIAFNETLEKHQMLYIIRHEDFLKNTETNTIRQIPNTYSRWEDREQAELFDVKMNGDGYKHKQEQKKDSNRRRSLGQKYKLFINGKEYDSETIKELYAYAYERNLRMNCSDEYIVQLDNNSEYEDFDSYFNLSESEKQEIIESIEERIFGARRAIDSEAQTNRNIIQKHVHKEEIPQAMPLEEVVNETEVTPAEVITPLQKQLDDNVQILNFTRVKPKEEDISKLSLQEKIAYRKNNMHSYLLQKRTGC